MDRARRFDKVFFSSAALLILAAVFAGFARTYYLAGVFRAPLPDLLIHIHGAVFSAWILLLITQTSFVAAGRVDLHRRLGLLGFSLACLMLILGLMAAVDELVRHSGPGMNLEHARAIFTLPLTDMTVFSTLLYFGFRYRFNPSAHKRLMLIATVTILDAAIVRWPIPASWWHLQAAQICSYMFLVLLAGYDLWSTGRIHRVTLWASTLLIVLQEVRIPIGRTAVWQSFAAWVEHLARSRR
jgi:hypothetical protein